MGPVEESQEREGYIYRENPAFRTNFSGNFQFDQMVNYVTPGYATAVFVSVGGIRRSAPLRKATVGLRSLK